jgi:hypothetical protein
MAYFKLRFINNPGIVGKLIDWQTNSLWDHVEIETETGTYIGAHFDGGIQERPADYCKPTRERRYSIPCSQTQLDLIMASARADIGTPYNFRGILGLALHSRKFNDPHRAFCSEFALEKSEVGRVWMLNTAPGWEYLITPEILHTSLALRGNCTYSFGV